MDKHELILDDLCARYGELEGIKPDIREAFTALADCFAGGHSLYVCGNGGSASDALHIVGELMKSFVLKRVPDEGFCKKLQELYPDSAQYLQANLQGALPAYALVENSALTMAYINDVDAEMTFAQQVYGYARPGDVVMGISTSGNARNVANAFMVAKAKGASTIGLTGGTGGIFAGLCDICVTVPETETYKIQEYHLPIYHALCLMVEEYFFGGD